MAKGLICHKCKDYFPKEELIQVTKTRRMCNACYSKFAEEEKYHKMLMDLLFSMRNGKVSSFDTKQVKDLKAMGYTSQEIGYTLTFMLNYKNEVVDNFIVSRVAWYYEEAKKFAEDQQAISQRQANGIQQEIRVKEKKVETTAGKHAGRIKRTRWTDLSALGGMDNE